MLILAIVLFALLAAAAGWIWWLLVRLSESRRMYGRAVAELAIVRDVCDQTQQTANEQAALHTQAVAEAHEQEARAGRLAVIVKMLGDEATASKKAEEARAARDAADGALLAEHLDDITAQWREKLYALMVRMGFPADQLGDDYDIIRTGKLHEVCDRIETQTGRPLIRTVGDVLRLIIHGMPR